MIIVYLCQAKACGAGCYRQDAGAISLCSATELREALGLEGLDG